MRKKVLAMLLSCTLLLPCLLTAPVSADTFLSVDMAEIYKQGTDGNFTMIYNLESGKIKVNFDFRNTTGTAQNAVLKATVLRDGEIVTTVTSDPKALTADVDKYEYLAVDVDVPDDGCQIVAQLLKAGTTTPLSETYTFWKKDNVVLVNNGNILRPLSKKATLAVNGVDVPLRREYIQGLIAGVDTASGRDSADRWFNVALVSVPDNTPIELTLAGLDGVRIADGMTVSPIALEYPRELTRGEAKIYIDKPQNIVLRNWSVQSGEGFEDIIVIITPLEEGVPYKHADGITYYAPGQCPTSPNFSENQFVYFEKGFHPMAGILNTKSGMTLYFAPGATVEGRLMGQNVHDVKIYGRGILECRKVYKLGGKRAGASIYFEKSQNIDISGIGTRSPFEWQTLYVDCDGVYLDHLNIMGVAINNDGIDIEAVRDMTSTNNFVMCGDDGYGWHAVQYEQTMTPEHPFGGVTDNVYAENTVFYNVRGGNPVRIGSSMEQEIFKNVTIKDTYTVTTETGYGLYLDIQDWATVSDMTVENYYVEEILSGSKTPIRVEVLQGGYSSLKENSPLPPGLDSPAGKIENVTIKNFWAPHKGSDQPVLVGGYDADHTVHDLFLENVSIQFGTNRYTGGYNTKPLDRSMVRYLESTKDKGAVYVTDADVIIR